MDERDEHASEPISPPGAESPPVEPAPAESTTSETPMMPGGAPSLGAAEPQVAPAVAWAPPAVHSAMPGTRSTLAAIAGVILLVLGVIGALLGLLVVAGGALIGSLGRAEDFPGLENFPGLTGAIGGFFAVVGVIIVVYSLAYVFGGIGVLRSREWGRVTGIVVAVISGLVWLAAVASPGDSADARSGIWFPAILLITHAYVLFALTLRWRASPT